MISLGFVCERDGTLRLISQNIKVLILLKGIYWYSKFFTLQFTIPKESPNIYIIYQDKGKLYLIAEGINSVEQI